MQNLNLTNLVLGAILLIGIVRRQLEPRTIRFKLKFYLILIILGIASINDAFTHHHLSITPTQALLFSGASLLSAVVFAGLRAWSYHFWLNDTGLVMRQGNWLTVLFWIMGVGGHLLTERLWTGSAATLLLYLGITLLIQRGGVWWRAYQVYPSELENNRRLQARSRHHH